MKAEHNSGKTPAANHDSEFNQYRQNHVYTHIFIYRERKRKRKRDKDLSLRLVHLKGDIAIT